MTSNSDFSTPEIDVIIPSSTTEYRSSEVLNSGTYYWKVRATSPDGDGPFSVTRTFALRDTDAPDTALLSPENGAIITDQTPLFDWEVPLDPSGIIRYTIQVSTNSAFSTTVINTNIDGSPPDHSFTPVTNLAEGTYFWHVKARDTEGNEGSYSTTRSLTIDITGPTINASPTGATFSTTQSVTLSSTATDLDAIYYTTDGSIPDNTDTEYTGPISISSTTTLKFIGYDTLGNAGPVGTETYTIVVTPSDIDTSLSLKLSTSINIPT